MYVHMLMMINELKSFSFYLYKKTKQTNKQTTNQPTKQTQILSYIYFLYLDVCICIH